MALSAHTIEDIERLPLDRPVLIIVRHAERPSIPQDSIGADLSITKQGQLDAHDFGRHLHISKAEVFSSPILRAVQTAEAFGFGPPTLDHRLGDPGVCVADPESAWPLFRDHSIEWVVSEQLAHGSALPGLVDAEDAAAALVHGLMPTSGMRVAVTHDAILAVVAGALFCRRDLALPGFLDALFIWPSGAGLRARYLGHEVLLDPHTLKPISAVSVLGTRIYAPNLEITIAEHCNISCIVCSHRAPVSTKKFISPDKLLEDLTSLEKVYHVDKIRLMGGEPLLHPHLVQLIKIIRSSRIAQEIELCTNGRLLMVQPAELWRSIDRIALSIYPDMLNEKTIDLIKSQAGKFNVSLNIYRYKNFRYSYASLGTKDESLVARIWHTCHIAHFWRCHNIHNGRFAICPQALLLPDQGRNDVSSVELSGENLRERLLDHLDRDDPLPNCTGCLGSAGRLIPHRQEPRTTWGAPEQATVEELLDYSHLERMEKIYGPSPQGCLVDDDINEVETSEGEVI